MPIHDLQPRRCLGLLLLGACAFLLIPSSQSRENDKAEELLAKAAALLATAPEKALELASQAVKLDPADPKLWFFRGTVQESLKHYAAAVADFDACLKLDPKLSNAYQARGVAHFQLGKVKESAADFDEFVKQKPERGNGHWQRGIALYYAGRFEDGKKQFEGYEKVDTNDVENAIWHFLCNAQLVGIPKAQEQMLKIGNDRRVPMRQIYDLYRGRCKPTDVLAAAKTGAEELRGQQLFYANLYLGIYAELEGNRKQALDYLEQAATRYRIEHYMGDVARVHWDLLKAATKKEKR